MCLRSNCRIRIRWLRWSVVAVVFLFSLGLNVWGQAKPSDQTSFDLARVIPDPVLSGGSGSVAFLNEKLIALCWHAEDAANVLYFLEFDGTTLHPLGSGLPVEHQFLIHREDDGDVLITGWIHRPSEIFAVRTR